MGELAVAHKEARFPNLYNLIICHSCLTDGKYVKRWVVPLTVSLQHNRDGALPGKNNRYEIKTLSEEMRGPLTEFSFLASYYEALKTSTALGIIKPPSFLSWLPISLRDGTP